MKSSISGWEIFGKILLLLAMVISTIATIYSIKEIVKTSSMHGLWLYGSSIWLFAAGRICVIGEQGPESPYYNITTRTIWTVFYIVGALALMLAFFIFA